MESSMGGTFGYATRIAGAYVTRHIPAAGGVAGRDEHAVDVKNATTVCLLSDRAAHGWVESGST